eukprot:10654868-Ditylum_brightwellii.AAC.1
MPPQECVGNRMKKEEGSGIMWTQLWELWVVHRKSPTWDYVAGFNVGVQKGLRDGVWSLLRILHSYKAERTDGDITPFRRLLMWLCEVAT